MTAPMHGDEALRLIRSPGCPVCGEAEHAEEQFFKWLVIENYGQFETIMRLKASLGLCAAHTRRLLAVGGEAICVPVFGHVLDATRQQLAQPSSVQACLACEGVRWTVGRTIHILSQGLAQPEVLEAYRAENYLCVPHALDLLAAVPPVVAGHVAAATAARLEDPSSSREGILAGSDRDAEPRRRARAALARLDVAPSSGPLELERRLELSCCPVCLARGELELQYLDWLLAEHARSPSAVRDDLRSLCKTHVHDIAASDKRVEPLLHPQREQTRVVLGRFLDELATLPPEGVVARARAIPGHARDERSRHATTFARWRGGVAWARSSRDSRTRLAYTRLRGSVAGCHACHAADTAERRESELLMARLLDSAFVRRYEKRHGLCARHVLAMAAGPGRDLAARALEARLASLAWEIDEAARKRSWSFRHESAGDEETAWLRVAAQLDGRTFLGGPAAHAAVVARPVELVRESRDPAQRRTLG